MGHSDTDYRPDTTLLSVGIILTMRIVILLCLCVHLVSSCFPAPSEETTAAPATTAAATTADPCANCDCSATTAAATTAAATTAAATTTAAAGGRMLQKREVFEENTYEEQIKTLTAKLEEAEARAEAAEMSLRKLQKN